VCLHHVLSLSLQRTTPIVRLRLLEHFKGALQERPAGAALAEDPTFMPNVLISGLEQLDRLGCRPVLRERALANASKPTRFRLRKAWRGDHRAQPDRSLSQADVMASSRYPLLRARLIGDEACSRRARYTNDFCRCGMSGVDA
jgi:hypothetical protein